MKIAVHIQKWHIKATVCKLFKFVNINKFYCQLKKQKSNIKIGQIKQGRQQVGRMRFCMAMKAIFELRSQEEGKSINK